MKSVPAISGNSPGRTFESLDSFTIAHFLGAGKGLMAKVRVFRPECACDAFDLVAATVGILAGFIKDDIFGVEFRSPHASLVLLCDLSDVSKTTRKQARRIAAEDPSSLDFAQLRASQNPLL